MLGGLAAGGVKDAGGIGDATGVGEADGGVGKAEDVGGFRGPFFGHEELCIGELALPYEVDADSLAQYILYMYIQCSRRSQ